MEDIARKESRPFSWNWPTIKCLFVESYKEWDLDEAPRLGASLAYYTVLSLAPLLVVVIGVAGLIFGREATQGRLMYQIDDMVGRDGAKAIEGMIQGASDIKGGIVATLIGTLALLFGASSVVAELRSAMNKIWNVPPKVEATWGDLLKQRSYALGLVLGTGFLLMVSLVLSASLAAVAATAQSLLPLPPVVLGLINNLISLAVVTGMFALMFRFLPDVKVAWRDVIPGAAFTAILFTLGKFLIGLYLGKASFGSTFGAAGSLVIVLVWIYYSSQIFFFGAEFTQIFARQHGSNPDRPLKIVDRKMQAPNWMAIGSPTITGNAGLPPILPMDQKSGLSMSGLVGGLIGSTIALGKAVKTGLKKDG